VRDYWVYVPAQYDAARPACLMVFQDGAGFVNPDGAWKTPALFDQLIHEKAMPVTVGVFIDPGVLPARSDNQQARYNRSYEYDGMSDRYVRLLDEEILPEVGKKLRISMNPDDRAIAGSSSGAIAAFTAAWHRPESFHRVLSFIGSYVNLRGGNMYSSLVRKMEPKPLRVFLQDGSNDLNIYSGSWWQANNDLASALEYAGYEMKFVTGTEGHNSKHGSAIFADALKWLWEGHPRPVSRSVGKPGAERHYITEILDPSSAWQKADAAPPPPARKWTVNQPGLTPAAYALSTDSSLLLVADRDSRFIWSFQLQPDGQPGYGEPFYRLEMPEEGPSGVTSMTVDTEGYLYVACALGIQVCDQPGRVVGIIANPAGAAPIQIWLDGSTLHAHSILGTFSRKLRRTGVPPGKPVKPPKPRL
jgi:enterochelin esterase-like enzyme